MAKVVASKITWIKSSDTPQKDGYYYKVNIEEVKKLADKNFHCFGYYEGKVEPKDENGTFRGTMIFLVALDSNLKPLVSGKDHVAAIPCPPYCNGDIGGSGPEQVLTDSKCTKKIPTIW